MRVETGVIGLSSILVALVVAVAAAQPRASELDDAWTRALTSLAYTDAESASPDPECIGLDGVPATERPTRLRQLAASWVGRSATWTVDGPRARGLLGPPRPAMPTICMTHERGVWRFAGFIPGV